MSKIQFIEDDEEGGIQKVEEDKEFEVNKSGKLSFTQKAIILRDIKKIERSLETDQNVQIRIYIYFAMCTLSGVVGMVLVLASMGMFSPNNQAPHSTDAVMFGIAMVFFVPCLVWFKYRFIPSSMEDFRMRRQLWRDRRERYRLDKIRTEVYFSNEDALPQDVLDLKNEFHSQELDEADPMTAIRKHRAKFQKIKKRKSAAVEGEKEFERRKLLKVFKFK